jgi:hypothetical protein
MRGAQPAQHEVEAHQEECADCGKGDYQPEDVNGRLPLYYSSGAMVTRSPASSAVNST